MRWFHRFSGALRDHPGAVAVAISAVLSAIYLLWQPQTLDLSAQTFRADLWDREGWVIWSPGWYSGHAIPGYSLLYPPLGAWLGPALVGALSAVASAALFARVARRAFGERAWLGVIWFGFASVVALYGGRITFALGLAVGLAAVLAVQRRRSGWAAAGGLVTVAASPVAGLYLLIACAAVLADWLTTQARPSVHRAAASAAAAAALGLGLMGLAFPTDGFQPFAFSAFVWIPLAALAVGVLAGSGQPVLRWAAGIYLAVAVLALVIDSPLGGNVVRLGATFAGPLLAILLIGRRPVLLAIVALPLLWWQWTATVRDIAAASGDPSTEAAYYAPLLEELGRRAGEEPIRVEVPPTRNRWESVHVAERFPLARGWLRQLESEDFDLFDADVLEPDAYASWLRSHGVSYVAVSDADPDYLAESELQTIDSGVSGLKQVWSGEHWRLYRYGEEPGGALVSGPGELLAVEPDGFTVRIEGLAVELALGYSPYFEVVEGSACVERIERPGPDMTRVTVPAGPGPGEVGYEQTVRVEARFSLAGVLGRDRSCSG